MNIHSLIMQRVPISVNQRTRKKTKLPNLLETHIVANRQKAMQAILCDSGLQTNSERWYSTLLIFGSQEIFVGFSFPF